MQGGMVALKPFFYFLKNIYRSFCLSCFMTIREIQILFFWPCTLMNYISWEVLFLFLASNFIHLYSH